MLDFGQFDFGQFDFGQISLQTHMWIFPWAPKPQTQKHFALFSSPDPLFFNFCGFSWNCGGLYAFTTLKKCSALWTPNLCVVNTFSMLQTRTTHHNSTKNHKN